MANPCVLHEDTFIEYFEPYRHPDAIFDIWGGIGLETFGEDFEIVRRLSPEYLWTVIDDGSVEDQWIIPWYPPCEQGLLSRYKTSPQLDRCRFPR